MGNKYDPLEEAKVKDEGSGRKKRKKLFSKKSAEKAAAPAPAPEPAPAPAPAPPPAPKAAVPAPVPPAAEGEKDLTKQYRVVKDAMVSINGNITKLREGKVISAKLFGGPVGLGRILEQVEVEEV